MNKVTKIENPAFQTMKQIEKHFIGNWVLISNVTDNPRGGVVRYTSKLKSDGLFQLIMELDNDFDTYGDCLVRSAIPVDSALGGLGL